MNEWNFNEKRATILRIDITFEELYRAMIVWYFYFSNQLFYIEWHLFEALSLFVQLCLLTFIWKRTQFVVITPEIVTLSFKMAYRLFIIIMAYERAKRYIV